MKFRAALLVVSVARVAAADPHWEEMTKQLSIIELLIPDLRGEVSDSDDGLHATLSWPFAFYTGRVGSDRVGVTFVTFVEPQLRLSRNDLRGVLGERFYLHGGTVDSMWGPFVELGGVLGQDGSGGFAGLGIAVGAPHAGVSLGVVVRAVVTDQETRGDLALDLSVPFNAPFE